MSAFLQKLYQSSHLSGANAAFVEALYERYLDDPDSVSEAWRKHFTEVAEGGKDVAHGPVLERFENIGRMRQPYAIGAGSDPNAQKQAAVFKLINAYRSRGHLQADLDPLELAEKLPVPDLDPAFHGLEPADLDHEFQTTLAAWPTLTLKDLITKLQQTYCGSIGVEYMYIADTERRRWLQERVETPAGNFGLQPEEQRRILEKLTAAEGMERFLHTRYVGQKRFSLEGGDSLIPLLDEVIRRSGADGVKEIVLGMAHRGRLNVLVNTVGKAPGDLFREFEGKSTNDDPNYSGDVKYHMGFSSDVMTPGGSVHLALAFNPSHLEIVNPVVLGSVRARQTRRNDTDRRQVLPIVMHGDAAFAGQGVVMELFNMSQARGFSVGGTVHVVINNQVGFTTSNPNDARSTHYCTDVAKIIHAPVLHVNADDPEAVLFCARLAYDYRARFKEDVVIDLVCYRRHGHNEADEPAATQPLMYQVIRQRASCREMYADKLEQAGVVSAEDAKSLTDDYRAIMDEGRVVADLDSSGAKDEFMVDWSPFLDGQLDEAVDTGVKIKQLRAVGKVINTIPDAVTLHARVQRVYEDREKMLAGKLPLDWGCAELLAYATLLQDGYKLRLVGQDSGRGTFFHRHAVMHDQTTGRTHIPLAGVSEAQSAVTIIDSLLSEEAVMGFEYGYATADPQSLVIWEGQFGDFANGAQVVIDQFITSGEAKWGRLCALVLFLPHGYEGQGPEHSSARLERFLQLCALENIQVCAPTTPAQMFHMIRRQMKRRARKPLVVMTPKSMLRNRNSVSALEELTSGSFQRVINDSLAAAVGKVRRVVLCSGKVYYDIAEECQKREITDIAVIRVEQLYPFPRELLTEQIARYRKADEVVWCQEEPMNQGAWFQIRHHLQACIKERHALYYAGRPRSPSPAAGHFKSHLAEQAKLVDQALTVGQGTEYVVE